MVKLYLCGSGFDRSTIHICANGGVRSDRLCIDRLPLDSGQILLVFFYDVLHAPLHHILRDDDGGSHSQCKHSFTSLHGFHCNLDGFLRLLTSTSGEIYCIFLLIRLRRLDSGLLNQVTLSCSCLLTWMVFFV